MNAIAALLLAVYLGGVLVQGNGGALWAAVKVDAPNFIPWLIALLILVVLYQSRGYLGPANALVAAVVIGVALAALLLSSDALARAVRDIGKLLSE